MGLDVYIVPLDAEAPCQPLACSFDEANHTQVFHGSVIDLNRYPQLRKMENFEDEAQYVGEDLQRLIAELDQVIPQFDPPVAQLLTEFRETCERASAEGQAVYCLGD
jgi:hypothetical protein